MKTLSYYINKANVLVDEFHKAEAEQQAAWETFEALYETKREYTDVYEKATEKADKAFRSAVHAIKNCYLVLDAEAPIIRRHSMRDSRDGIDSALFIINCWNKKIKNITDNQ